MRGKIKQTFWLGRLMFEKDTIHDFTEEQIGRLVEYIEPIKVENKNINLPPKDKMIKESDVKLKTKKGGKIR
jgi:hypothetical protein